MVWQVLWSIPRLKEACRVSWQALPGSWCFILPHDRRHPVGFSLFNKPGHDRPGRPRARLGSFVIFGRYSASVAGLRLARFKRERWPGCEGAILAAGSHF
jgi:hypothetical protein